MAKREQRKRIFAREQVNVDERTGGIRGSSRPSNALGDLRGRGQVMGVGPKLDDFLSGASSAFKNLKSFFDVKAQEEREEEREFERMVNNQKMLDGRTQGTKIQSEVNEKLANGELLDPQDALEYAQARRAELNPTNDRYFEYGMSEASIGIIESVSKYNLMKLEAEQKTAAIKHGGTRYEAVFSGCATGITPLDQFSTAVGEVVAAQVEIGISEADAWKSAFDHGISKVRTLVKQGNELEAQNLYNAWVESGFLEQMPPDQAGRNGFEQFWDAYDTESRAFDERKLREDQMERERISQAQNDNFKMHTARINQADVDGLVQIRTEIEALSPEELVDRYGQQAGTIREHLESTLNFVQYGIIPVGNQEALATLKVQMADLNSPYIQQDGYLEASDEFVKLTPPQRIEILAQRDEKQKIRPAVATSILYGVMNEVQTFLNPKEATGPVPYLNVNFLEKNPMTDADQLNATGRLFEKIFWERARERVDASDPKYQEKPYLLDNAYAEIAREIGEEIKNGNADWLVEAGNSGLADPKKLVEKHPLFFSQKDLTAPENQKALDDYIFGSRIKMSESLNRINQIPDLKLRAAQQEKYRTKVAASIAEKYAEDFALAEKTVSAIAEFEASGGYYTDGLTALQIQEQFAEMGGDVNSAVSKGQRDAIERDIMFEQENVRNQRRELEAESNGLYDNLLRVQATHSVRKSEKRIEGLVNQYQEKLKKEKSK